MAAYFLWPVLLLSHVTRHFSWDPLLLSLGGGCGSLGLLQNANFSSGWLYGINVGHQIDWKLERRGLDHPKSCLLCDQTQETIQYLLCTCVFARQFWHTIFSPLGFVNLSPSGDEIFFADWWRKVCKKIHRSKRKGMNITIILGAWYLWIHRNKAVFNGENPSLGTI
ncbi:Ribosomal RNA small subunit methyltransferase chloroplastic [Zea mays]|jgi:hypothetical protein|uniref:Ribosomal RNA small subunit methyltransferase chloroplastic n=1 Tax=Zea mays TaxID=4577 RepID=A0A1D6QTK3_MAIZE|nr:Ribosomal RNA small subunit methyltransferase chloroplastic [Zea mays]AQK60757.1 Ribosomal RNA small subunit methyltransferase chloroplastic [Zea mays]